MKGQTPKYAHLQYETLHKLDITIPEYWYLDMVYQLSRDKYCYKSLENIAKDMKMTVNGVVKMRDRLAEKGLLIKKRGNKVKTSVKYNSVYFFDKDTTTELHKNTTEYKSDIQLSINKNNSKNNKDYRRGFYCLKHPDNFVPGGKVCGYC